MIELATQIKEDYTTQVLTLCTCIKIYLQNGKKIAFTTHVSNMRFIEEPDLLYLSKGFTPTALSQTNQMSVDNLNGEMIIDNENILQDDLEKGIYNNAYFEIFEINYLSKDKGFYTYDRIIPGINGTIGEVKRSKLQFDTEYRSLAQYLALTIVDLCKVNCNVDLYDNKCKVNINALEVDGITFKWHRTTTIESIIKSNTFTIVDDSKDSDFYNNGKIEFLTGNNKGRFYTIKSWDKTTKIITIQIPANYPISIGDQVKVYAGCNKYKGNCKDKFNNYINYRGFYDIPGIDFIISGGGTKVQY